MDTQPSRPASAGHDPHGHGHNHDHSDGKSHDHAHAHGHCCGTHSHAEPPAAPDALPPAPPGAQRYRIPSMDCAAEESEIRHALAAIAGIEALRFDLGQRLLTVSAPPAAQQAAVQALGKIGFTPQALDEAQAAAALPGPASQMPRLLLALLLALAAEGLAFFAPDTLPVQIGEMGLAALAIALAGFATYKKGLLALRAGRLNINALMTVAVSGAFLIGQWPEAAMVMALYAIAELIEARSVDRARHAIKSLLDLTPQTAEVRQADGQWLRLPTAAVAVGALVRLRPGERVPLDGVVSSGASAVDQSPVTGESVPVDKTQGDPLYAGTINQHAALEFTVSAAAADSTLARIIHAVEQAQSGRAPTQRFVDRFAAVYTPAVFVLALALALLAPWLLDWSWVQAAYKALVLLVIACPCALVISTPVTVVSGLAAAARRGILIKGGVHLEQARLLKVVALDKTGTLTEGRPRLVDVRLLRAGSERTAVVRAALALAGRSDHPVSKAIADGLAAEAGPAGASDIADIADFSAQPGRGVQGRLDGRQLVLANPRWLAERGQSTPALELLLGEQQRAGRSVSLLADEDGALAMFAVADTIKPGSRAAVAELRALGLRPVMLSGDNQATAEAVAREAGIEEVRGQLLPEDKLAALRELRALHGACAMVGDGINDAPALAQADIGFAMGGAGTHTAMEAADIVVMNDDLRRLPETLRLSRRTHALLWQNISLALGIKAVFLVAAVFGNASMWMAVFADMGASLLVVFNGLRLLRQDRHPSS